MQSYQEFWRKMFVWDATATRSQYWIPWFINIVVVAVVGWLTDVNPNTFSPDYLIHHFSGPTLLFGIFAVLIWLAEFTIRARRLHDTGRSNWWILLYALPIIGWIWFFILMLLPSRQNDRWDVNQTDVQ
ncbi:DUF805 domain-containing protein [Furfurilactobacillus entadae]|uniref:DUF805 domain-containing protein n=1 Tax=Furfurilactobacillus entadae TaxID=2922307 RepID=UPI0035ECF02A